MESAEFHEWLDAEIHRLDREVEDRVVDAHVLGAHGVIEHARNDAISEIRRSAGKIDDDEKLDRATKRKIINDVAERIRRTGPSMGGSAADEVPTRSLQIGQREPESL